MVELYLLPPVWGLPNISPPCMKLETWLRIAQIPYEPRPADLQQEAPKGKAPYIRDRGTVVSDSTLIIEHLRRSRERDPDQGFSKVERAISLAFRRMMKENFYWVVVYIRWGDDTNWPGYKEFLGNLLAPGAPGPQKDALMEQIRGGVLAQMHGHGMGRHGRDEIYSIGIADITAVSDFLGDKPFFMGAEPTTADAVVYSYVAHVIHPPFVSPVKDHVLGLANMVEYDKRMRARFYPEKSSG